MQTARVRFHTTDELVMMDLLSVESLLFEVQSLRSRLDGQEATLHSAIGVLQGANGPRPPRPRPHPGNSGSDSEAESGSDGADGADPDDGGGGSGPPRSDTNNGGGGGGPSSRAERERLARAKRLEAHRDVADALNAGSISSEQADGIMKANLDREAKRQLLAGALCQTTDETLAAIRAAIVVADKGDAERKFRRQRNRRKGICGVDEHGMTWINILFDPIIGAAFKELFDKEVRRQFQIDKLESNPLKLRTPYKIGADACAILFGVSPDALTVEDINADDLAAASTDLIRNRTDRTGASGGHRVNLTMDISMFRDPAASAYTQTGQPVPVSLLHKVLCSAEILLWVTDSTSSDPGRYQLVTAEPYATEIQKQCLTIRDGGCVWKGCNMAASRCAAHHLTFTREGGKTVIDNLALLCPTHHTRLHQMPAHLRAGSQPHQWVLEHDLNHHLIDKWTNPPPRPPPKTHQETRGSTESEHDPPCRNEVTRTNSSSTRPVVRIDRIEPLSHAATHESNDLPPRW